MSEAERCEVNVDQFPDVKIVETDKMRVTRFYPLRFLLASYPNVYYTHNFCYDITYIYRCIHTTHLTNTTTFMFPLLIIPNVFCVPLYPSIIYIIFV